MKIKLTYYVEVIDNEGATLGYKGPFAPTNTRYAVDVISDGTHVPMEPFMSKYPNELTGEILKSARGTNGYNSRYAWTKS